MAKSRKRRKPATLISEIESWVVQKEVCWQYAINIVLTLFTRSSLLTHFSQLFLSCFWHFLLRWLLGPRGLGQLEPVHVPGETRDLDNDHIVIWFIVYCGCLWPGHCVSCPVCLSVQPQCSDPLDFDWIRLRQNLEQTELLSCTNGQYIIQSSTFSWQKWLFDKSIKAKQQSSFIVKLRFQQNLTFMTSGRTHKKLKLLLPHI